MRSGSRTITATALNASAPVLRNQWNAPEQKIVGCEWEKLADKFADIVHAHCDPPPLFTTAPVAIRDTNIVVVSIEEGDNKPYVITDEGLYLRVGATTRRANRYEMDRFYAGKQVSGPLWR